MSSQHPLFREEAWQQHIQRQEKDVLPRFISPPIFLCSWLLFGLILAAALLAWWGEVPITAPALGIVLVRNTHNAPTKNMVEILLFLPATYASKAHTGQSVQVKIDATGLQFTGAIARIEPGTISPADARLRYALNGAASGIITQPSVAIIAIPKEAYLVYQYAGSLVNAQIQIGWQRALLLLPGIDQSIGGTSP